MTDFLLLHGMCVTSAEWERVIPALQSDTRVGRIVAPDMPGRGGNRPEEYASIRISDYVATALAALRDNDLRDTILVGHSGGGAYLQAVAAAEPQRVRHMVFLCAAIPRCGRSLLDFYPRPVRWFDRALFWLLRTKSKGIRPNHRLSKWLLCNDLQAPDCQRVVATLVPEPQALVLDRIHWPVGRLQAPATYIHTTNDRIIPPWAQRRMARNAPVTEDVRLPMGHAAPVVYPERLVSLLLSYT